MFDGEAPVAPWSMPLAKDILTIKSLDAELDAAALGVAIAFLVLLQGSALTGWLPAVIDEQRTPLCGLMAPIPSFCFVENHGPPIRVMHQYVSLLVERFRMSVGELVMAYACVERVLILHPTTLRASSIRPMLLGASMVACKMSREGHICLSQFCDVLHDVLDVDVSLLACIELQMLEVLDWSVPMALGLYQTYADAIFDAASGELGRRVVAPSVVPAFDSRRLPRESVGSDHS